MAKIISVLAFLSLISCDKIFVSNQIMEVTLHNKSTQNISKVILGVKQGGNFYTDSVIVENITLNGIAKLILREKNLQKSDGAIGLDVYFQDGSSQRSGCCYLTNGYFQNKGVDFMVYADSISIKIIQ